MSDALDETIRFLTVRADGEGWIGDSPDWFGDYLFGGFVLAQAVHAATRTAPESRRIHSLHARPHSTQARVVRIAARR